MRDLDGRRMTTRVKGRAALERSLMSLLLRVHRFARVRAATAGDRTWAAEAIAGLQSTLAALRRLTAEENHEANLSGLIDPAAPNAPERTVAK
jgi:hypothetical protein